MKKTYRDMDIRVVFFEQTDVIRTSDNANDNVIEMPEFPEEGNFFRG